jgi:hypothetical protein
MQELAQYQNRYKQLAQKVQNKSSNVLELLEMQHIRERQAEA